MRLLKNDEEIVINHEISEEEVKETREFAKEEENVKMVY
jgi:hypothetical protein